MGHESNRAGAEERFREVFAHLAAITAYARRRGSPDPSGIAAETMAVAWRRLEVVPTGDPLPWLYATARNLVLAEARQANRHAPVTERVEHSAPPELFELDAELAAALKELSPADREALLLIAWEELTPGQAAAVLGINPTAFRVRLLRARGRLRTQLEKRASTPVPLMDLEST